MQRLKQRLRNAGHAVLQVALSPFRLLRLVCLVLGFVTLVSGTGITLVTYGFFKSLPDLKHMRFEQLKERARAEVTARLEDKSKLAPWIDLKDISRDFLFAVVMSEDSKFFEHKGLNYDAIIDSLAENLRRREYAFGASTITQQVTKNLFLGNEKTLTRKLKEFLITRRLEANFSKNQIVELYLNIAELGPDVFGARAAAEAIFRKPASAINAAEGSFIALMLPSPRRNYYSIFQNQNLSPQRRHQLRRVLRDMAYNEFISPAQFNEYVSYDYFRAPEAASAVQSATVRTPASKVAARPRRKRARRGRRR